MCLICTEKVIVVIVKCGNITCHYKSSEHKQIYPQNMEVIKNSTPDLDEYVEM